MDTLANITVPRIGRNLRIVLWATLLVLTGFILCYPVVLNPSSCAQIESIEIFRNLPVFAALFIVWLGILLALIFTRSGSDRFIPWEKLGLVLVFIIVYLGFWTVITPLGRGDIVANLGHARYLELYGWQAATHNNYLTGFDVPGIYFAILTISKLTGADVFGASTIFLLTTHLMLALLLYVLFLRVLKNVYLAAIGAILAVVANLIITGLYSFHGALSIPFMLCFLLVLSRRDAAMFSSRGDFILAIFFFVAAMLTHFVTSMAILFIIVAIWVAHAVWAKRVSGPLAAFSPLMLMLMVVFSVCYQVYWAVRTTRMLASFLPVIIQDIVSGELFLTMQLLFKANLGAKIPLWASIIRMFWFVIVYILGALMTLVKLCWPRKLSAVEIKELGAIIGVGVMGVIAVALAPQGNQFHRFIMYGSIFLVPFVIRLAFKLGERWKKPVMAVIIGIILLMTFPTFLVNNGSISTTAFYPHEDATGRYLEAVYGDSEKLTTFSTSIESGAKLYYYYLTDYPTKAPRLYTAMKDEAGLWRDIDTEVEIFVNWKDMAPSIYPNWGGDAVFISSELMKLPYQHILEVPIDDPKWQEMEDKLLRGLRVYDNGNIRLYVPR